MDREALLSKTALTTASDYQLAIFDHIATQIANYAKKVPVVSLLVRAVAGAGKTTTLVAAARLFPAMSRVLMLAFNYDIAEELKRRLPRTAEAKTLNALGHSIVCRYLKSINGSDPTLDQYKVNKIMRVLMTPQQRKDYGDDVKFLVGMCKAMGIVPEGADKAPYNAVGLPGTDCSDETLKAIGAHFTKYVKLPYQPTVYGFVRKILLADLADTNTIDFDDQKYFSVVKRAEDGSPLPCFKYDAVFCDEVQDVNGVDIALIRMVSKPNAFVCGVGDKHQAIYGFRGADVNSTDVFKAEFGAVELGLSITYRCAKAIVREAAMIFDEIEARADAPEGIVEALTEYGSDTFRIGDMILCRNNAPLVSFAYKLIAARVPVFVKGRDIGKNLLSLIDKLVGKGEGKFVTFDHTNVTKLAVELTAWCDNQIMIAKETNPDDEGAVQRIEDVANTIRVFIGGNADGKVETVRKEIADLFSTEARGKDADLAKGKVILSTGHKSKGLESDRVFLLDLHLLYPQYIRQDSWQWEQEKNLEYVMKTRAKNEMYYIDSDKYAA